MGLFDFFKTKTHVKVEILEPKPLDEATAARVAAQFSPKQDDDLSVPSQTALTDTIDLIASDASTVEITRSDAATMVEENLAANPTDIEAAKQAAKASTAVTDATLPNSDSQADSIAMSEAMTKSASAVSEEMADASANSQLQEHEPKTQAQADEDLDAGLSKTRQTWSNRWNQFMANFRSVDEDFFDDLEETLIGADVGAKTAVTLTDELRDEVKLENAKNKEQVSKVIIEKLIELYERQGIDEDVSMHLNENGLTVILFVGVNGVGKTTTIGKMSQYYKQAGKQVLLAAADTFRAGATEQLVEWGRRNDIPVVTGDEKADPASVVYDGVKTAQATGADILFVDTAGRLQNNVNLMQELAKMKRIIEREIPDAPQEVLLVLDATTGQNALQQARLFKDSTDVTGIVLTKLDGTARGGIILPIRNELHLPVKWVGVGEQVTDLQPFNANEFVKGLFGSLLEEQ